MKFVARGEDRAGDRSEEKQDRHLHLPARATAQRAPEQHCQDRVFTQVTEFSDPQLNGSERRQRNLRIEPAEEWDQESRRMLS